MKRKKEASVKQDFAGAIVHITKRKKEELVELFSDYAIDYSAPDAIPTIMQYWDAAHRYTCEQIAQAIEASAQSRGGSRARWAARLLAQHQQSIVTIIADSDEGFLISDGDPDTTVGLFGTGLYCLSKAIAAVTVSYWSADSGMIGTPLGRPLDYVSRVKHYLKDTGDRGAWYDFLVSVAAVVPSFAAAILQYAHSKFDDILYRARILRGGEAS